MPAIADPDELERAIRFQAPDHIPMALEEAVIDWQASRPTRTSPQRPDGRRRRRRSQRDGLRRCRGPQGRRAQARRIDISAFAMIARSPTSRAERLQGRRSPTRIASRRTRPRLRVPARAAALQLRRHDEPRRRTRNERLFTRGSTSASRASSSGWSERRGLTLEHSRQWLMHVGLVKPSTGRRRSRDRHVGSRGPHRGPDPARRRASPFARLLRSPGGSGGGGGDHRLRSGQCDRGSCGTDSGRARLRSAGRPAPRPSPISTRATPRA